MSRVSPRPGGSWGMWQKVQTGRLWVMSHQRPNSPKTGGHCAGPEPCDRGGGKLLEKAEHMEHGPQRRVSVMKQIRLSLEGVLIGGTWAGSERLGFWGPGRSGGGDMERTSGAWRQVQRVAGRGRECLSSGGVCSGGFPRRLRGRHTCLCPVLAGALFSPKTQPPQAPSSREPAVTPQAERCGVRGCVSSLATTPARRQTSPE